MDETETTILRYLLKEDWPVTTEMVAKEVGMAGIPPKSTCGN